MKHTSWKRSLILVILFSLLFNACGTSTQNQINQRVSATLTAEAQLVQSQQRKTEEYMDKYGFIPITTQDPDFAVAAIARNGEKLISMTETDSQGNITNVKGAIWVSPDDEVIVVYLNEDGLPDRLIIQEYVFLFSNYSESTVDIAIISPSGSISVSRNVSIELEKLSNYHSFSPKFDSVSLVSMKNRAFSWAEALEWTSIIMGITSCAGSIAATAATAGGLIPFLVASCGSLLCDLVNFILPEDNEFLEATSLVGNTFGCVSNIILHAIDCEDLIVSLAKYVVEWAFESETRVDESVSLAEAALKYGSGSVQVTLTWDNSSDLDLWITEPDGEKIGFEHQNSDTSGILDVDDRDGYGPENIFWPYGQAPSGQYIVQVNHYGVTSPTNYKVLVQVNGQAQTFSDTITSGQWITITKFEQ